MEPVEELLLQQVQQDIKRMEPVEELLLQQVQQEIKRMEPVEELLLQQVKDKYLRKESNPHSPCTISIEKLLLQQVRQKYPYKELPHTLTMAPTSPLQTLLKPKITTTVSATFRFTYTNASSNNLSTLSKAAHNLKSMIYKYKLEQQGFPQYSRLPLEIQRKIWIYTFPDPRVVPINYDYVNNICESTCSTPVALRVCSVSRVEALRFYSLSFGTTTENGRIYFRFGFDIPLLLTNIFCNVGPVILPVEKLERFVKTTKNLEKLDTVAMIPGMIKSVFGPHPRPRPYLCDTLIARLPALKILLSANCTRETDDLTIGMSGFLTSYKTIGTKKCSDLSLSMKAYALGKDAQHRTDNFKKFWGIHWNQAYLELHGLPLVLVADEYLKENEVRQFSRVGDEWGIAPSIRSVLNPFLGL